MARLTQWIMALAGLLTSASMSSCSRGNENEEPRPPVDTEQRVATPEKDGGVDRLTPADDASADEKPLIASENWYEFNVSDNRLSIPPKWYELYDVDIEDYKAQDSQDSQVSQAVLAAQAAQAEAVNRMLAFRSEKVDLIDWSSFDALREAEKAADSNDVSKVSSAYYGVPPAYKSKSKSIPCTVCPIVRALTPEVTDGIDKRVIQKVLRSHFGELRACYENAFERDKNVSSGRVIVSWIINKAGTVPGVTIKETTLKNKRFEDCLVKAISRWRFPKPRGVDFVHVEYPLVFESPTDD